VKEKGHPGVAAIHDRGSIVSGMKKAGSWPPPYTCVSCRDGESAGPEGEGHEPKKAAASAAFPVVISLELTGNRVDRAGINAGCAIGTGPGVDDKQVVSLADCFHRAGGFASAAGNTFTRNNMGHDRLLD
jgi:hypothetical protein